MIKNMNRFSVEIQAQLMCLERFGGVVNLSVHRTTEPNSCDITRLIVSITVSKYFILNGELLSESVCTEMSRI